MSRYQTIKTIVDAFIKANGRREITGPVLNNVLQAAIDSLGKYFQFVGVAVPTTDPGTPDENVAYIAGTSGTYAYMNNLQVASGEIAVLKFDGLWQKQTIFDIANFDGLQNYYKKTEVYDKTEVDTALQGKEDAFSVNNDDLKIDPVTGLQFINRENGVNTNGMGYVILRRSKTFAEQVTDADTIYEIRYDFDLGGASVTIPSGCVLKFIGGKLSNGTLTGQGTIVVSDSRESTIFSDVSFSGSWSNSRLTAKNFGCSSNLVYESQGSWTYKGITIPDLEVATPSDGIDNGTALGHIAQFLSRSSFIDFEFNGEFYSDATDNSSTRIISIYNASNIRIYGGNLMCCLYFYGSSYVTIEDVDFTGIHRPHEFPLVCPSSQLVPGGGNYFVVGEDAFSDLGVVAGSAILPTASQTYNACHHFVVRNCNFEMRSNGVQVGDSVLAKFQSGDIVRDCVLENITFDSIFYQPVVFRCKDSSVSGLYGRYCGQPIDFSSGSSYCVARNVDVRDVHGAGPKVDATTGFENYTHNNTISDAYVEIVDTISYSGEEYALKAAGASGEKTLSVSNSFFKYTAFSSIRSGAVNGVVVGKNSSISLKDTIVEIGDGFTNFFKIDDGGDVEISNCRLVSGSNVSSVFSADKDATLNMSESFVVSGNGSLLAFRYQTTKTSVKLTNCSIIATLSWFAYYCPYSFAMKGCSLNVSSGAKLISNDVFSQCISKGYVVDMNIEDCKLGQFAQLISCSTNFVGSIKMVNNKMSYTSAPIIRPNENGANQEKMDFIFRGNEVEVSDAYVFDIGFYSNPQFSSKSVIRENVFKYVGDSSCNYDRMGNWTPYTKDNKYVGITKNPESGTSANRPTLTASDAGWTYYDSTLVKFILWNGSSWVNMDGTTL